MIPCHRRLDPLHRIEQIADGSIVIQGVDDIGDVFAHIAVDVPLAAEKLRCLVDQIGGQDTMDQAVLICLVKSVKTGGEEAEGGEDKDLIGFALLEGACHFQNTLAGGDHIIYDDHILAFYAGTEEFMGHNGVAAVDDAGVVPSLVEHTHIQAKHVGNVDRSRHTAFIGADYHHVVVVDLQAFHMAQKSFDKLISRLYGLETVQRDGILHAGIVGVKRDDIVYAHIDHFLQGQGAVQRFSGGTLVLAALIEIGHDDSDPSRLAAHGGDDTL